MLPKRTQALYGHVTADVLIDAYEVTLDKWNEVATWATSHGYDVDIGDVCARGTNHPVCCVDFERCLKWCNARSEKEGLSPCYYTSAARTQLFRTGSASLSNACVDWAASGYRLPTESEWFQAAYGRNQHLPFPWGSTISFSNANYTSAPQDYPEYEPQTQTPGLHPDFLALPNPEINTAPVGSFAPNELGLYDIIGNVEEMCWDVFDNLGPDYWSDRDPRGPSGYSPYRLARGGSWARTCQYALRDARESVFSAGPDLGFRCVRRPW